MQPDNEGRAFHSKITVVVRTTSISHFRVLVYDLHSAR